jgi:hypothetical protein
MQIDMVLLSLTLIGAGDSIMKLGNIFMLRGVQVEHSMLVNLVMLVQTGVLSYKQGGI